MPFVPTEIPQCPKCGKNVYAAEERVAGGKKWHKQCFKCGLCNKGLDSTNCAEHDNQLYCKVCHARKFGPKGYGFGGGAGALSMDKGEHLGNQEAASNKPHTADYKPASKAPEGEGCPRCGGYVYAAEQMLARGRAWHKKCYKCKDCTKGLDSTNTCEGPDNDIYCKVCYGKNFGPKGYGYGQGAGALQSDAVAASNTEKTRPTLPNTAAIKAPDGQGCPRCGGAVYAAEQMLARGTMWHKSCFNCKECHRVLDSVLACDGPDRDVYCKLCYAKKYGPKGYGFGGGSAFLMSDTIPNGMENDSKPIHANTASIKAADGKGCPRCGGAVFAAEQMLSKGKEWHKGCFNCGDCHRPLDSVLACDGPDSDIYCKACYGKKFGPKGFGYGHMPTLVSVSAETEAPSEVRPGLKAADGEGCPRCGFAVYAAEQMVCKNRMWHRRCFNCADCHRSLDSTNLNDAPDSDIYCAGCYRKKWGPHGIGYGIGAGTLSMS